MAATDLKQVLLQDFWVHLAGVIAIAIGLVDLWNFHAFARDSDLLFIIGGFAGMGLKIINGSAAALRTAALDTAFQAARAAGTAAAAAEAASVAVPPPAAAGPPA
jgi:hypothetical protein